MAVLKIRSLYWVFTIIIIAGIIFLAGWESIKNVFLRTNPFILLLLCLFQVFTLSITAYRWYYLLKKFYRDIGFREFFAIYLTGNFVESVTPSSKFGGELTRAYLFRQRTLLSYQKITAILLLDKFLTLLPFLFISTVLLVVTAFKVELPLIVYISFLFLGLVLAVLYRFYLLGKWEVGGKKWDVNGKSGQNKCAETSEVVTSAETATSPDENLIAGRFSKLLAIVRQKIKKAHGFLAEASSHSRHLISPRERYWLVFLSFLVWIFYPLKIYVITSMLDFDVGIVAIAVITYTAYLVGLFPLLPGGLGSFEGTMALMFASYGDIFFAQGLAIALVARFVTYWFPLLLSALLTAYLTGKGGFSLKKTTL